MSVKVWKYHDKSFEINNKPDQSTYACVCGGHTI